MKIIKCFIASCMMVSLMVFGFFSTEALAATNGSLGVSASASTLSPGDTVSVALSITDNPGTLTLIATAHYDQNVFELVSREVGPLMADNATMPAASNTSGQVVFSVGNLTGTENVTGTGTFGTFVLRVKEAANNGNTSISVTFDDGANFDMESLTFTGGSTSVSIVGGTCLHSELETVAAVSATCENGGNIEYYHCPDCGKYYSDSECSTEITLDSTRIAALGHSWNDGEITTPATCTTAGVKTYTCTRCGETRTEDIAALGHTWNDGEITTPATCTTAGVKTYTCTRCGETRTEDIAALGHDWDEGVVTQEASDEHPGIKTYTCNTCGDTRTEEFGYAYQPVINSSASAVETDAKSKIENAISTLTGYSKSNIAFYEINIQRSVDDGLTFSNIDNDSVPDEGVAIIIPYPTGTSQSGFDFVVLHLLGNGTVEKLVPTKTATGLRVTAHSFSPFGVTYKAVATSAPTTPATNTTNTTNTSNTNNSSASTVTTTSDTTKNPVMSPKTGDVVNPVVFVLIAIVCVAAVGGAAVYKKYQR